MDSSRQKYYLVSDLHMGGDGALQHCDYTTEFIEFLKGLENAGADAELLIVGDTFRFWELALMRGVEKIDHIITAHQAIFDQLRATGGRIKITMMVGNHDYDLGCNTDFTARLRAYNIHLDKSLVLIRPVGDKKIWIEHGQHTTNSMPSPTTQSLCPSDRILYHRVRRQRGKPAFRLRQEKLAQGHSLSRYHANSDWILSNYFYREMSAVLRHPPLRNRIRWGREQRSHLLNAEMP
jgi:UDP-2,3-diacylglucosamine pyrophosphatase LpxH